MKYNEIEQYLSGYIKTSNPQYAVMIKGKWGCGKTYLVKQLCENWKYPNNIKNKIVLQPIYISLNGISTCSTISLLIKRELYPILFSKGARVAKKVLIGTVNYISKSAFDIDKDGNKDDLSGILDSETIIDILTKDNDSVKGEKILFFDDIERAKLPTDELFGYINNLVEHSKCKVIIICEEDKLRTICNANKSTIKYDEFKEKLIGKTLRLEQDLHDIVIKMMKDSKSKYLIDNNKLIADLFVASNVQNLRIIKQFITDFIIFITGINTNKYNDELFAIFIKNVIAYLVISYCEYKSGNTKFYEYIQSYKLHPTDDEQNMIRTYHQKYSNIIRINDIKDSSYGISLNDIIYYIENGNIPNLQEILSNNKILNDKPLEDWEKLNQYAGMDSVTFFNILKNVKQRFYYGDIHDIIEVLYIAKLLLQFNKMAIIKCSNEYIVRKAKKYIDNIYKDYLKNKSSQNRININEFYISMRMSGSDIQEVKDIYSYAIEKIDLVNKESDMIYCKNFWEKIDDSKAINIGEYFNQNTSDKHEKYFYINIFEKVDLKVTAKKITHLSYDSKLFIKDFIHYRYERNVNFKNELGYLQTLNEELIKSSRLQNSFDKAGTNEIIELIKCILINDKNKMS